MENIKLYIDKVISIYQNQEKNELLSTNLKTLLGLGENKGDWSAVSGCLVSQGVIKKTATAPLKYKGKPVYFYALSDEYRQKMNEKKSYLVLDQNHKEYFYRNDETIDEDLAEILKKSVNIKLTVYMAIKTACNEIKITPIK